MQGIDMKDNIVSIESIIHWQCYPVGVSCPICGGQKEYNPRTGKPGQWAHFICNTKSHLKRYGKAVIDSKHNGVEVCSLKCNNAVQLKYSSRPILCDEVAEYIKNMECMNEPKKQ